jgi:glycosyltransferase involved in cell wall biosynthesis
MEKFNFSLVVPVYNEGQRLKELLEDLIHFILALQYEFEIIVVDDGSTDESFKIASQLQGIKVLRHDMNRGYGSAIKTGMLAARFDRILIIDADGTYPIEKIAELISASADYDMVVGARIGAIVHQSVAKKIAKWPINQLANYLVGFRIPDLNSGLRIFRKDLASKYLRLLPNGFSFTTNITLAFLSDGFKVKYIPINYFKRSGKSKVRPARDALNYLVLVIRMILFYNPLKIFIPISGLFFIASIVALFYDVWFLDNLTEKSIIFFVGFVQITVLGFLADLINKRSMS